MIAGMLVLSLAACGQKAHPVRLRPTQISTTALAVVDAAGGPVRTPDSPAAQPPTTMVQAPSSDGGVVDQGPRPIVTSPPTSRPVVTVVVPPLPLPGQSDVVDPTLACIRRWESGGDYTADTGNDHYGAYQFNQRTWRGAVARAGHPEWSERRASEAPADIQDAAAAQLLSERGLQPWPTPARECS